MPLVEMNDWMTNDNNERSLLARALNVLGLMAAVDTLLTLALSSVERQVTKADSTGGCNGLVKSFGGRFVV